MRYHLFDPTGNITALVTDWKADFRTAADRVMEAEPSCEQVGFVLPGGPGFDAELQMAGGEFCGNASMSAAALFCMQQGLTSGQSGAVTLKVSGTPDYVAVEIRASHDAEGSFSGRVSMPQVDEITEIELSDRSGVRISAPLVRMPGISHVIVPEKFGIERAEALIADLCRGLDADGLGIMLVDEAFTRITPVVYVPASDTLFREHSCASGTSAVGACLAAREGRTVVRQFQEPGGVLGAEASPGGRIILSGHVKLQSVKTL